MRKAILFLLIGLSSVAKAQYSDNYFDIGAFGGVSTYTGDLAPTPFGLDDLHLAGGVFVRYNAGKFVSLRGGFNYGRISGSDAGSSNDDRRFRNLSFRSDIYEVSVQGEWNLMGYHPRALERTFSPYIFLGIGAFHFNPTAKNAATGTWVNLRDLGTEGQAPGGGYLGRTPYSTIGISVPIGVGVKVAINSHWTIGAEVGFRKTFTDYLDDVSLTYPDSTFFISRYGVGSFNQAMSDRSREVVTDPNYRHSSQRGDNRDYDWYIFAGITISYNFVDEGLAGATHRLRRKPGCKQARM